MTPRPYSVKSEEQIEPWLEFRSVKKEFEGYYRVIFTRKRGFMENSKTVRVIAIILYSKQKFNKDYWKKVLCYGYLLEGGKKKRDLVLITFVAVSCRRRKIFDEPGSSISDPGLGSRLSGRFDEANRIKE